MGQPLQTQSLGSSPPESSQVEPLAPGDCVDGTYRVERLLGQGGGGAVFLVTHQALAGARFALKVLRPTPGQPAEALAREGRLAAQVTSAHVVKIAALGRLPRGDAYLVMEHVEGPTLDQLLEDRDLTAGAALDCARQLCLALEAAHEQGLVHGDVSLRNLFATPKPDGSLHLQLGDFGLARRVRKTAGGTTLSVELGAGRGTPRFMAPEAIAGQDGVDERSDLFSAGVVLYRLLSGAWPFDGSSTSEVLAATLRGQPPPLSQRREEVLLFEPLVMRCLASSPAARVGSARELREELELLHTRWLSRPARPGRLARFWRRGRGRVIGPAALAAFVALAALGRHEWQARASIPLRASIACPDTEWGLLPPDPEVAHAVAQALCARVGAAFDLDWAGGGDATVIATRLQRDAGGALRLEAKIDGRVQSASGSTPYAAAVEAAALLAARAERPLMSEAEVRRWGASSAAIAAEVRRVWRRRTTLLLDDPEQEPRAVLAKDPALPLMHLLLADVERDPARRREARAQALANADRLPPERAAALRGYLGVDEAGAREVDALELLRAAYTAAPDDVDVGVLYLGALVNAGRAETARAVVQRLQERFPRRALLATHLAGNLPAQTADATAPLVAHLVEALPESRMATDNIVLLTSTGRIAEAEAARGFARRLGLPEERLLITESLLALVVGDPARVERTSVRLQGSTGSWSQIVGTRMRLAALLLRGQVAAAQSLLQAQIAARRSAGDEPTALLLAAELLQLHRRAGGPTLPRADLDWMEHGLAGASLSLNNHAFARTEHLVARSGEGTKASLAVALQKLDQELEQRAGADALALAAARLRTLPLARLASGAAEAAARWRHSSTASLDDRVRTAFEAALALLAAGDTKAAEDALRLAASPYSIERHALESVAARLRLAELLLARGQDEEARTLRGQADRAWSEADFALRDRVRAN